MVAPIWLLIALPLLGAVILLLGGKATNAWGHLLGCAAVLGSFVVGAVSFVGLVNAPAEDRGVREHLFTWVPVGQLRVDFGLQLDQLSVCFVLLITGVGFLIHLYSVGYMAHDPERRRFFAYLNLFVAAMLLLVVLMGHRPEVADGLRLAARLLLLLNLVAIGLLAANVRLPLRAAMSSGEIGILALLAVVVGVLLTMGHVNHAIVASLTCFAALVAGAPYGYADWAGMLALAIAGNVVGGLGLVTVLRLLQVPHKVVEARDED